jgi:hypothetical protein
MRVAAGRMWVVKYAIREPRAKKPTQPLAIAAHPVKRQVDPVRAVADKVVIVNLQIYRSPASSRIRTHEEPSVDTFHFA